MFMKDIFSGKAAVQGRGLKIGRFGRFSAAVSSLCLVLVLLTGLVISCGKSGKQTESGNEKEVGKTFSRLRIAEQYGLAYAPLQIMRRKGYLEEELPDLEISWQRLGNTAAIREAMLAGRTDIGFMGIPPFLIGYDRGMGWKIFTGLSEAPLGLVTWKSDIRGIEDFGPEDRIALPQPGSIQHILLSMACERELGRADVLDDILITANHPDGMQALLNRREISAHFTSPPYLMEELSEPDMRMILSGREAMGGEFTFIVGVANEELYHSHPDAPAGIIRALQRAEGFLREQPFDAASILAEEYGISPEKTAEYLGWEGLRYSRNLAGIESFIHFMFTQEYIKTEYRMEEVVYTPE